MGKLPDIDTFDCKQIVDVRRMNHSISEIVRQLGFSRTTVSGAYQEYLDGGQKLVIGTATDNSDVVQYERPIFDDFFQHLWPYIGNNTASVVFQMVKRLWLIRIDQ
ncbi:hypothetical protein TNCV_4875571 [Trichonephila clavipes]|nr:hypothetical protein TNCV_4875571 [Trichonephila clavipes]